MVSVVQLATSTQTMSRINLFKIFYFGLFLMAHNNIAIATNLQRINLVKVPHHAYPPEETSVQRYEDYGNWEG